MGRISASTDVACGGECGNSSPRHPLGGPRSVSHRLQGPRRSGAPGLQVALQPPRPLRGALRRKIRGLARQGFSVEWCPGHVPEESCETEEDLYRARGNAHADRIARTEAARASQPSPSEIQDWERETAFLHICLKYVPRALMLWPPLSPTSGHHSIPKRDDYGASEPKLSFLQDALGPLRDTGTRKPADSQSADGGEGPLEEEPSGSKHSVEVEAPPAAPGAQLENHLWRLTASNRWVCAKCLCASRATLPQATKKCPGFAAIFQELLENPRGHRLQFAMLTSGAGAVVLCTRCGHHCTSNRRTGLHKKDCEGARSEGARSHIRRFCDGLHPSHKVHGKVLEKAVALQSLRSMAEPSSSSSAAVRG